MAYVADTMIQQWIANQLLINKNELVRGEQGAYDLGRAYVRAGQAPISQEEASDKMKTLSNQPFIAVMNKGGVTVSTARTAVGTAQALGTSAKVTMVRNTVEAAIKISYDQLEGNGIGEERYFATLMQQAVQGIRDQVDTVAIAAIDAAKSQVQTSAYPYAFDLTADAFLVDGASGVTDPEILNKNFLTWLESLPSNYLSDGLSTGVNNPISILASPNCQLALNYSKRFKDNNYENLNQIINGLGSAYFSTNIALPDAATQGVAYSMTPGTYGLTTWANMDARKRRVGNNAAARIVSLPGLDHEVEMYTEANYSDQSGTFGATNAKVYDERITFSFDYVTSVEYNSAPTTVASGIKKGLWRTTA